MLCDFRRSQYVHATATDRHFGDSSGRAHVGISRTALLANAAMNHYQA